MISNDTIRDQCVAAGFLSSVGAALTVTSLFNATAVYTGVGVVTVTLGQDVDAAQCDIQATAAQATFANITVTHTSDTVKVFRIFDAAGVAAEGIFNFRVSQHAP